VNTAEGPLVAITTEYHRPQNLDRPSGWPRVHVPAGRTLPDVSNGQLFRFGLEPPGRDHQQALLAPMLRLL
jgi:hypothetical protein